MLCVCKDKKRKYQSLGISVSAAHWYFKKNQLKEDCPDYVRIQLIIDKEIDKIKRRALDNKLEGKEFTATTLLESADKQPIQTVASYYETLSWTKAEGDIGDLRCAKFLNIIVATFFDKKSFYMPCSNFVATHVRCLLNIGN